jgi:glucosamine 6-phosphate synthetase-like amidotransferase/phosphosugar isomerase protein
LEPALCGIIGVTGGAVALDVVVRGLSRLEYRGYDSAGVVLEAVVAFELADALLEKTGGDTVAEVTDHLAAYRARIAAR